MISLSPLRNKIKVVLPLICLNISAYAISNNDLPNMGHNLDSPLRNNNFLFNLYAYQGFYPINEYGWYIAHKKNPIFKSNNYNIEVYYPHPTLDFIIFKRDLKNDLQINPYPKLEYLATPEDLHHYSQWTISLAFPPLTTNLGQYPKPLSAFSKIIQQKEGKLILSKGENIQELYKEICPIYTKKQILLSHKNIEYIENLLKNPQYNQQSIQIQPLELQTNIDLLNTQINKITIDINCLKGLINSHIQSYVNLLSRNGNLPNVLQIATNNTKKLTIFKEIQSEINDLQQQSTTKTKEKNEAQTLLYDPNSIWNQYLQLNKDKQSSNQYLNNLHRFMNDDQQKYIINCINSSFKASYTGVADKEDQGGLILVESKTDKLFNNEYVTYCKLVGLTSIQYRDQDYKQGEQSVAINLTTPEVHQWILQTIDIHHRDVTPQTTDNKRKRSVEETEDPIAKWIKQEPEENDADFASIPPLIKKEEEDDTDFTLIPSLIQEES